MGANFQDHPSIFGLSWTSKKGSTDHAFRIVTPKALRDYIKYRQGNLKHRHVCLYPSTCSVNSPGAIPGPLTCPGIISRSTYLSLWGGGERLECGWGRGSVLARSAVLIRLRYSRTRLRFLDHGRHRLQARRETYSVELSRSVVRCNTEFTLNYSSL